MLLYTCYRYICSPRFGAKESRLLRQGSELATLSMTNLHHVGTNLGLEEEKQRPKQMAMSRWCPGTCMRTTAAGRAAGAEGSPLNDHGWAGDPVTHPPTRLPRKDAPRSDRRTYLGYLHRYAVGKQNRAVVRGGLVPGFGPESWGGARHRGAVNSFFILLVSTTWLRERAAAPLTVSSIPAAHTYWVHGHTYIYIYIYLIPRYVGANTTGHRPQGVGLGPNPTAGLYLFFVFLLLVRRLSDRSKNRVSSVLRSSPKLSSLCIRYSRVQHSIPVS